MPLLRDNHNSDGTDLTPETATEPEPKPVQPYEGAVVAGEGAAYYLVEKGKRRLIPDMPTFYSVGLRPVRRIPQAELDAIPKGKDIVAR